MGLQGETENIRIGGDKTAPRNTVKAIVERDQNVKLLRERSGSLQALREEKLQQDKWYPIRLDAVRKRKTGMFNDLEKEKSDFWENLASMAVYLAKEREAIALQSRRLIYVSGEVVSSKDFQDQL